LIVQQGLRDAFALCIAATIRQEGVDHAPTPAANARRAYQGGARYPLMSQVQAVWRSTWESAEHDPGSARGTGQAIGWH